MNKKVSIVMTYFNRLKDLKASLKTIAMTKHDNVEVIIVDDASEDSQRCKSLIGYLDLDIKILRIDKKDKYWKNSCVAYNIGFKQVSGEIIIIQNPECLHIGDAISYVVDNLTDENYLAFSCYSIHQHLTNLVHQIVDGEGYIDKIKDLIVPYTETNTAISGFLGWYNHPHHRPCAYHFCSAITKKNLDELGGFDERYGPGYGFDDNEILARIKRKGLKIEVVPPETGAWVIHQFHAIIADSRTWKSAGIQRNNKLYHEVTLKETGWKAN